MVCSTIFRAVSMRSRLAAYPVETVMIPGATRTAFTMLSAGTSLGTSNKVTSSRSQSPSWMSLLLSVSEQKRNVPSSVSRTIRPLSIPSNNRRRSGAGVAVAIHLPHEDAAAAVADDDRVAVRQATGRFDAARSPGNGHVTEDRAACEIQLDVALGRS